MVTRYPLQLKVWSLPQWLSSRETWNQLLAASEADALFASFDWLTLWWRHYGESRGELLLLTGYSEGKLVAAAPFTLRRLKRGPFRVTSLQMLGASLGASDSTGALTEYQDVIAQPEHAASFREQALDFLRSHTRFSEFGVSYTHRLPEWRNAIAATIGDAQSHQRNSATLTAYQADLTEGFDAYLARLSGNARRKIFHQRKILASHGTVRYEIVAREELESAFQDLNRFHQEHWRQELYSPKTMHFHAAVATASPQDIRAAVSRLWVGNRLVSVLHDLSVKDRQYNLQMGYEPSMDSRLSLGILHLGYAMEHGAANGIRTYDFLAGRGRRTDYKKHYSQASCELRNLWLLRGPFIARAVRLYDKLSGR